MQRWLNGNLFSYFIYNDSFCGAVGMKNTEEKLQELTKVAQAVVDWTGHHAGKPIGILREALLKVEND